MIISTGRESPNHGKEFEAKPTGCIQLLKCDLVRAFDIPGSKTVGDPLAPTSAQTHSTKVNVCWRYRKAGYYGLRPDTLFK